MIEVLRSGMYTTIQDLGRFGHRNLGVPVSGIMDMVSANLANLLLNNQLSDAVLEITMTGPTLLFTKNTIIAITGANISPKVNGKEIYNGKRIPVNKGDVLSFGTLKRGTRCYLAIKEGIQSELILGSRSQFKNITKKIRIEKGDQLQINQCKSVFETSGGIVNNRKPFFDSNFLEVTYGPEFELFSEAEISKFLNQNFTVSKDNNRMGYRMEESVVPHELSLITSPVIPGTVQLLPSGRIIILMKDGQTAGGYPRIFQLSNFSISVLAQKKIGEKLRLKLSPI